MPGNEFGDRVHNFFAQESSLQGHPQSQVVEGNWQTSNDNFWVGSQRQAAVLNLNANNYNLQDSDIHRGQGSYPFHATHGLNFTQSNLRPDFGKSQSPNDQHNLNGYMHGNQFLPTRQNETNFLIAGADSEHHHLITSRGLSGHELQQGSGNEHQANPSLRSDTTTASVSFDLFGGQHQKNHHQSSMLQPAHGQHLEINKMLQQQQHQLMIRKMKDLQSQQQFQQLDLRQQNLINQVPTFAKQASGSHSSTPVNGNTVSSSLQYPWTAEVGTNWLNHGSLNMEGSPNGIGFPANLGQTQHLVDLMPQQVDQSLYGVPVSSSRGLTVNQYSHKETERPPMLQMSTSRNPPNSNHEFLPDQVGVQDGTSISRQKFENMFGDTSSQSLNKGTMNMGGLQHVGSIQTIAPQDFLGRRELTIPPEIPNEKSTRKVVSSSNEASLDPAEEKILFGSDGNIWAAFGNAPNMSGESGNLFDNGELNGFPSIQCGSWSALMQSAVAETSSSSIGPQEEWSGLMFNNIDGSSANQSLSICNNNVKRQTSLDDNNMRMHSASDPGSIPRPNDLNTNEVIGLNLLGHKFQDEPDQGESNEVFNRFVSVEEAGKWSNCSQLQKSVGEGSQLYGNISQHSLESERNAMKISSPWAHGQSGVQEQSNGRNALVAAIPPVANRMLKIPGAENLSQNSQNHLLRVMQGESVHGSSLWKLNSVSNSSVQMDPTKSTIGNPEANKSILSLNNISSAATNSCSVGGGDKTCPFIQNNYILNQWKKANPSAISQGGENMGRMLHQAIDNQGLNSLNSCNKEEIKRYELENNDMKENSNDSHHSNLSRYISTGYKETGSLDANDSRSLLHAKQKSTNHLSRKVSGPRKFQYHPMGNLDEDLEPSYGVKLPNHVQIMPQHKSQFDQSNILVQFPRNSKVNEKGGSPGLQKHDKVSKEEACHGSFPGYAPNISVPSSGHSYTQDKASSPGQNMLELLPKVDQSRNHDAMMPLNASECNVSPQLPEAANFDGTANYCQQDQSPANKGFGLQLGPPSLQRFQIPEHSASSQKAQDTVNLMSYNHSASEMGEKGQQMVPSLCFPNNELQSEFKDNGSAVPLPQCAGNDKMHENFQSAFSSGALNVSQLQNQQITRASGKMMNQNIGSSLSNNASCHMQRRSAETVLPDAPGKPQKANFVKSWDTSQQTGSNDERERGPSSAASTKDSVLSSQHFNMHDISHEGGSISLLQNMGTNLPTRQHNLGEQYQNTALQFSELSQPNIVASSSFLLADGDVNVCKGGNISSELSSICVSSPNRVVGKEQRSKESSEHLSSSVKVDPVSTMENTIVESSYKNPSNNFAAISSSTENKIETFGQSLKPNAFSHQNYGLPNQMKDLDSETDPNFRVSKRMKGPDIVLDVEQVASMAGQQNKHNVMVGDSLGSSNGVPTADYRMPSFSCSAETSQICNSQCENVALQVLAPYGSVPHSNSSTDYMSSVRAEKTEDSQQTTPSSSNQYGTFKNGQMLHQYHAHRETPLRPGETLFTFGKSLRATNAINSEEKGTVAPTDTCQDGNTHQASIPIFEQEHFSLHSSQLNDTGQILVISSLKKRKSATSDLHPWYKEISDDLSNLWTLSVAEAEWNKVANHHPEKVDYDAEFIEDGPPLLRSKRRLILTTQLTQQLFRPPPENVLSTDASSKYESVIYAVSRTVLGDACNIVLYSSGLNLSRDGVELLSAKDKPPERKVDQCSGEVIEKLMGRSLKLENDFARLDKDSSIFDLRMECQDMDKFSVINRLAKFHGRGGHADNAEIVPSQKPLPQRYVAALPMPRNLPDMVQCLSL